jgi:hypothetical protein
MASAQLQRTIEDSNEEVETQWGTMMGNILVQTQQGGNAVVASFRAILSGIASHLRQQGGGLGVFGAFLGPLGGLFNFNRGGVLQTLQHGGLLRSPTSTLADRTLFMGTAGERILDNQDSRSIERMARAFDRGELGGTNMNFNGIYDGRSIERLLFSPTFRQAWQKGQRLGLLPGG